MNMQKIIACLLFFLTLGGQWALAQNDDYNPTLPGDPTNPTDLVNYRVEVELGTAGAGTVTGAGTYKNGTNVSIKATAKTGYKFLYWTKYGVDGVYSTAPSFTYTVASEDASFVAVFESAKTVTVQTNLPGAGTVSSGWTLFSGQTVVVSTVPNKDYVFQYWQLGEEETPINYDLSFVYTMGDQSVTLTAVYVYQPSEYQPTLPGDPGEADKMVQYAVELESNYAEAGTLTGAGRYEYGTEVTVRATVDDTYRFRHWTKGGEVYSDAMAFVYTVTTEDVRFVAVYDSLGLPPTYPLTIAASPEGSCTFSIDTHQLLQKDASFTVTATPKAHHEFQGWYVDDRKVGSNLTYTGTMPAEALTLTAVLEYLPNIPDDPTLDQTLQKGDVNGTGTLSVSDVTALIDILHGKRTDIYNTADVDENSSIDIDDVNELVRKILKK